MARDKPKPYNTLQICLKIDKGREFIIVSRSQKEMGREMESWVKYSLSLGKAEATGGRRPIGAPYSDTARS